MELEDAENKVRKGRANLLGIVPLAGLLRDLVYPPACSGCGIRTARQGGLCVACWCSVRFIDRPYCEVLGLPFSYDPGPGMLCAEAIAHPPVFDRLRSVAVHDGVARDLVHGLKYSDRTDLAPMMAGWMLRAGQAEIAACDAILAVPLHPLRLIQRKFNQSAELGRHLARQAGKPFLPATLLRVKRTAQQVGLSAPAREDNVRGAFSVPERRQPDVFGRRLVLVDDVFTTGATVTAATRALKRAGATDITVLTFARAIAGPI